MNQIKSTKRQIAENIFGSIDCCIQQDANFRLCVLDDFSFGKFLTFSSHSCDYLFLLLFQYIYMYRVLYRKKKRVMKLMLEPQQST